MSFQYNNFNWFMITLYTTLWNKLKFYFCCFYYRDWLISIMLVLACSVRMFCEDVPPDLVVGQPPPVKSIHLAAGFLRFLCNFLRIISVELGIHTMWPKYDNLCSVLLQMSLGRVVLLSMIISALKSPPIPKNINFSFSPASSKSKFHLHWVYQQYLAFMILIFVDIGIWISFSSLHCYPSKCYSAGYFLIVGSFIVHGWS